MTGLHQKKVLTVVKLGNVFLTVTEIFTKQSSDNCQADLNVIE